MRHENISDIIIVESKLKKLGEQDGWLKNSPNSNNTSYLDGYYQALLQREERDRQQYEDCHYAEQEG